MAQPPHWRLLALGLIAFWPQFAYLSSLVNNDNLLILVATVSLWLLLRLLREGPSWRVAIWLGLALGGALLAKASAMMLAFPVALVLLLDRRTWRYVPTIAGIVLVVAGWWYIRNTLLYADPTGIRSMFVTWASEVIRPGRIDLAKGLQRTPYAYATLWARFGHGAVGMAEPFYAFFDVLAVLGLGGGAAGCSSGRRATAAPAGSRSGRPC